MLGVISVRLVLHNNVGEPLTQGDPLKRIFPPPSRRFRDIPRRGKLQRLELLMCSKVNIYGRYGVCGHPTHSESKALKDRRSLILSGHFHSVFHVITIRAHGTQTAESMIQKLAHSDSWSTCIGTTEAFSSTVRTAHSHV